MFHKILLSCCLAFLATPVFSDEPNLLLLANGQVVSGKIRKQDSNYVVRKDSGSRIIFSAQKVVMVCSDWNDLYWQKCALLKATDVTGHMRLFNWCIKHDLIDAAQNQIDLLQHMSVSPTKLHGLDKRLDDQRLAIAERLKRQARELVRQADALAIGNKDYNVKQVAYEESVGQEVEIPAKHHASDVVAQGLRKDKVMVAKHSSKGQPTSIAKNDVLVDPFDPEEFNKKYVLRKESESDQLDKAEKKD